MAFDHRKYRPFPPVGLVDRTWPDRRIEHTVAGPESMLRQTADLVGGGPDWAVHVANIVSRCPHTCSPMTETTIIAPLPSTSGSEEAADAEPLLSWVIAPLDRA